MCDAVPKRFRLAAMVSLAHGLAHCASPVEAPSAFGAERYVCGAENAAEFEALLEECRTPGQSEVCNGVLSLRGTIDSEEVVLDTWVKSAIPADWPGEPGIARTLEVLAASPYFNIKLDVFYLAVPPLPSPSGQLPMNCATEPELLFAPCMIINLTARGGNYFSGVENVVRTIELESTSEMRASFAGDLARGGHLEGCFHASLGQVR